MSARPRVRMPSTASPGEVIMIRTLISHPMESGQRRDGNGNVVPRQIINHFECSFNGTMVFSCDLEPAVSTNPFLEFHAKVEESGTFELKWVDDDGSVYTATEEITVG